jgi:V/A-type H+-transporting ATPase subunit C
VLAKYDYHNLKVALKSKFLLQPHDNLYVDYTGVAPKLIKDVVVGAAKPEALPEHLARALPLAVEAFEASKNPQAIDIALDKHMFAYQTDLAAASENGYIIEYVKLTVDFYNLKTLLRVKNMDRDLKFLKEALCECGGIPIADFIAHFDKDPFTLADTYHYKYFGGVLKTAMEAYEQTGNFGSLEKLLDNRLIEHIKKSKYIAIGPEILLSYIFSKENEARQIRIIMTCKINDISSDVLRERLRDNHV